MTTTPAKPILQIVHITDLHFHVGSAPQNDQVVLNVINMLPVSYRKKKWLLDYWEDGRAGHALDALLEFESFLTGKPTRNAPETPKSYQEGIRVLQCATIPTWLVDTGDLSSVGDDASVEKEKAWVDQIANLMGAKKTIRLYGNHDAWPEKFPLIASAREISDHRTLFRNTHFPQSWPLNPESIALSSTGNCIDLYSLNSVIHDHKLNVRARGHIGLDRHWDGNGAKDQLSELRRLVAARGKAFRILLSHHPIHYPPPVPPLNMSLCDAKNVAIELINQGTVPLAHLVLSGHTHGLFPKHGALPRNAGTPHHPPLGKHQLQLIVGSLSKAVRGGPPPIHDVNTEPHQCQVLRFFEVPNHPDSIELQRAVIGRNNGTGPFRFMELPSQGPHVEVWESTFLNF